MQFNSDVDVKVLYEDNHLLVVEKPVNMLTQGDATGDADLLSVLKQYIKEKYNKPGNVYLGLVHRLDRPVGGVMVFARTSKAASRLSDQVRRGSFGKVYLAVVQGQCHQYGALL
jgi:23S rRNA pseudouridine1911/1915/1917 synthase